MYNFRSLVTSYPIKIFVTIIFAICSYRIIPYQGLQFFFSVSLALKEFLMLMIPFIIFSSVYGAFAKMKSKAIYVTLALMICVVISNFFCVSLAGIFSYIAVFGINDIASMNHNSDVNELVPLWQLAIPKIISNNMALLAALILSRFNSPIIAKSAKSIAKIVDIFLTRFFVPSLPIFILGFLYKLLHEDMLGNMTSFNPRACLLMLVLLSSYLAFLCFVVIFVYKNPANILAKSLAAPSIAAITTMSSAAALPFSLKAAETNTKNVDLANMVMPITSNIHMIGDSICIPIIAMIMLVAFGHPIPTFEQYLIFAISFVLTKFSGAGVPGGSILVMIPVLESTLGFTPEMVALITLFYMLFDPITTLGNVVGNNLFVIHFHKLYTKIFVKDLNIIPSS